MADSVGPEQIKKFIFARELSEVYLLLDHVSSRSDKSLTDAKSTLPESLGSNWIQKICEIAWPPQGSKEEIANQAALLLQAKDYLNGLAAPANGMTVAFTVLVAGEDQTRKKKHKLPFLPFFGDRQQPGKARSAGGEGEPGHGNGGPPEAAPGSGGGGPKGGGDGGGGGTPGGGAGWGGDAPSRSSLARLAYPGLVKTALRFRRQIKIIIAGIFLWLVFTCFLSWNVTTGHEILSRLDTLHAEKAEIIKAIAAAENSKADATTPLSVKDAGNLVSTLCVQPIFAGSKDKPGAGAVDLLTGDKLGICDRLYEYRFNDEVTREDLADWLAIWGWLKGTSHLLCGGHCLDLTGEVVAPGANGLDAQWASVLMQVLSGAVLPLCYGLLGAGAAVVRDLWGKMRDSLLSPRDLTLALGQLALGAVIGASIGLFIAPSGSNTEGTVGLTSAIALSASALSFIAGFGVESVFVALESLIRRVFNTDGANAAKSP
jgi:hypothetical protein